MAMQPIIQYELPILHKQHFTIYARFYKNNIALVPTVYSLSGVPTPEENVKPHCGFWPDMLHVWPDGDLASDGPTSKAQLAELHKHARASQMERSWVAHITPKVPS